MSDVSRETLVTMDHFINTDNLWFKELFADQTIIWDVLQSKYKEDWIQTFIDEKRYENLNGILLQKKGLIDEDLIVQHATGETSVIKAGAHIVSDNVVIMPGCEVEAGAYLAGPTVLGAGTVVRHGAYIRGGVISGEKCVIGHTTEVKSSIFANGAKAAHFAYVGDSILGNDVNLGAGTKLSNLKIVPGTISLNVEGERVDTGLRKFGAILGDECQTGCNSVLNPGIVLGKKSLVYPCVAVKKGLYKAKSLIK